MKTTIKLNAGRSVVVTPQKPGADGAVLMYFGGGGAETFASLTPDQAGVLMYALSVACEAHEKAAA